MKIVLEQDEMEDLFPDPGTAVLAVSLSEPITDLDERQIRAIEWVLITGSEELTLPCLINGNILFRRFLRSTPYLTVLNLVAGHLNSVKALAERVPCSHLIRPEQLSSPEPSLEGELGQNALEYAQHSLLWELFAAFDRWEDYALKYTKTHQLRRDKLAEKQHKNEVKVAMGEFITRAKTMVLSDEGLSSVLDDTLRSEDPDSYSVLARIRDLYIPEIILRMHEVFMWGADNLDARYPLRCCYVANASHLDDCFDLAAAVSDSEIKLYDSFRATNQLEDYLGKIKEMSIRSLAPNNLGTGIGAGLA